MLGSDDPHRRGKRGIQILLKRDEAAPDKSNYRIGVSTTGACLVTVAGDI